MRLKLNVEKSKLGGNVNVFGGRKFKIKSGNQNDVRKILKKNPESSKILND